MGSLRFLHLKIPGACPPARPGEREGVEGKF